MEVPNRSCNALLVVRFLKGVHPAHIALSAPSTACSPVGAMLQLAPGDPASPMAAAASPRAGLERALLFVSAGADGTVRLWSGELLENEDGMAWHGVACVLVPAHHAHAMAWHCMCMSAHGMPAWHNKCCPCLPMAWYGLAEDMCDHSCPCHVMPMPSFKLTSL